MAKILAIDDLDDSLVRERKYSEKVLKTALQQLEFHENNSPLAVIEFNEKFQITKWSKNATSIFGWSADEVLGKNIGEFKWVYEEDQERVALISAVMLASKKNKQLPHQSELYQGWVCYNL